MDRLASLLDLVLSRQFLRFVLVALVSTSIYAIACYLLITQFGVRPSVASIFAYLFSMLFNFVGQKRFAFESEAQWLPEVIKFCVMHGVNIAVSYLLTELIVTKLGLHFIVAIAATMAFVPFLNFIMLRLWVFRTAAG